MAKTIREEIDSYLNENDMYFVEEYDEEGFPINDEADDLVGYMTNAELCECVSDAMEYISDVQRKRDIEKACEWIEENLFSVNEKGEYKYVANNIFGSPYIKIHLFEDFRKAIEKEQ